MIFALTGIATNAVTKQDLGLTFMPHFDHATEPKLGSPKVHHEFLTALLNGIAEGKSPLSQGVARAAEKLGPAAMRIYQDQYPAYGYMSHHLKNVGSALHWATDSRDPFNSCHDYLTFGAARRIADHFDVPGGDMRLNMSTGETQGAKMVYERAEHLAAWVQNSQSLKNSLPFCEYASMPSSYYHPPQMDIQIFESSVLSAVTGIDYDVARLWEAGERIWNMRRAIMVLREDRQRKDDTISPLWFQRTVPNSQSLSAPLDRKKWDELITRYYELRGWETKSGRPARSRLEALGMKTVADRLNA